MNQLYRISQVRIADVSRLFSKTLNCDPASDHRHELALGIGVAVDVSLSGLD